MNDWLVGVAMTVVAVALFLFGWVASASTIGRECRDLKAFYVGEKVYECKLKEKNGITGEQK